MNRRTMPRLWVVLFACSIAEPVFTQAIGDVRVDTPRHFGYTIGDRIQREMHLSLTEPHRLDMTSLPEKGQLNRWLEISGAEVLVEHRQQYSDYRIVVDYQVVNAPQQLTSVTIPQLEFLTTGGANPIPVFIPEWTFTVGPVTNSDARENLRLQPDRRPRPIPVAGRRFRLLMATILFAGTLTYLAHRRWLLPRLKRRRYPFSRAYQQLRKLQRSDPASYRLGLQRFHEAVNATMGQVIFAGNLPEFVSANPKFAVLSAELSALYARSQETFFDDAEVTGSDASLHDLLELCRRCRALERSVA